jgi:hypothetical protein
MLALLLYGYFWPHEGKARHRPLMSTAKGKIMEDLFGNINA